MCCFVKKLSCEENQKSQNEGALIKKRYVRARVDRIGMGFERIVDVH